MPARRTGENEGRLFGALQAQTRAQRGWIYIHAALFNFQLPDAALSKRLLEIFLTAWQLFTYAKRLPERGLGLFVGRKVRDSFVDHPGAKLPGQ